MTDLSFYRGRRVLVTGHTGFKGSWLCQMLLYAGAQVTGYALEPPTDPSLFVLANLAERMNSVTGDVRDFDHLLEVFQDTKPEVVFHLAAQPIVRESYKNPRLTYETNVMGTVNLLECVRRMGTDAPRSVLNVTTDKVYRNREQSTGYVETDELDGFDPYSNSKSCSELVTHSYIRSFFSEHGPAVSTARAGNVIGGGDFAADRILPDCVRAAERGQPIVVRNPNSIRPYQHVLEPLAAYLMIAQRQFEDKNYAGYYNVGPDECDCVTTGTLAELFCKHWGAGATWVSQAEANAPHEANYLRLDCTKLKSVFGWKPHWHMERAVEMSCRLYRELAAGGDASAEMDREIAAFLEEEHEQLEQ